MTHSPVESSGGQASRSHFLAVVATLALALFSSGANAGVAAALFLAHEFAPDTIGPGSSTEIQYTLDNQEGGTPADNVSFSHTLPAGVTLLDSAFSSTDCTGTLTVTPGNGGTVALSGGKVGAGSQCVISVYASAELDQVNSYTSTISSVTSSQGSGAGSTATLTVDSTLPGFKKAFAPTSVSFGGRSTLTLTVDNTANAAVVPNLDFTDSLPAGMQIASPANASTTCGTTAVPPTLTATPGSTTVSLNATGTQGFPAVAAGASCTVTVDVTAEGNGVLANISSVLLANSVEAGIATAPLTVSGLSNSLEIVTTFTENPVLPGGDATIQYTLFNRDRSSAITGIGFSNDFDATLSGLAASGPSIPTPACGAGSTVTGTSALAFSGGSLAPGASCTFTVPLAVPAGAAAGDYPNSTSAVTGDLDGNPVSGSANSTLLTVAIFPELTKTFTDDPVGTGNTVTLEFTVTNPGALAMTDITFSDELTQGASDSGAATGFLPFPVSVTLPPVPDPPCGAGSSLALAFVDTDRQALELTGGELAASGSCTFEVTIDIPEGLAGGTYTNTTDVIQATYNGGTVLGRTATDNIVVVAAPQISKEFTTDPATSPGTVELVYTLTNTELDFTASDVAFTDDFSGIFASPLTVLDVDGNTCGGATTGVGTSLLGFSGGTIPPGSDCQITVALDVPGGISGEFKSTSSNITATVGGLATTGLPAEDEIAVSNLRFSKAFGDTRLAEGEVISLVPGETVNLTFTIDNTLGSTNASITFFTDNLAADLAGLAATGPATADTCGGTLSGTTFLTYTGGSVTAGTSCEITVPVLVPGAADAGDYINVTSNLSADDGSAVTVTPAVAPFTVDSEQIALTKEFSGDPALPATTVTLTYTLQNLDADRLIDSIAFSDDFDAALSGLIVTSAETNTCGGMASSGFPDTEFVYGGASLAGGASCEIALTLELPVGPISGTSFTSTTTQVTGNIDSDGDNTGDLPVIGVAAVDTLEVRSLTLSVAFDGPTTATGAPMLTVTVDNVGANAVNGLSFTANLDGLVPGLVATGKPVNPCGSGSAVNGTSLLALSGGSLDAGGSCSFPVTLSVPATATAGTFPLSTSVLTASGLTVAPLATADLVIEPPPLFAKAFAPASVVVGEPSTLTFTVDNSANTVAVTSLDFTDTLPAGLEVGDTAATTTCSGGVITAPSGGSSIAYTGAGLGAGASCEVAVEVVPTATGALLNTSGDLTSSSGNSGTAAATLTVGTTPLPLFTKAFAPTSVTAGESTVLTFTIDNSGSPVDATGLSFTDSFPAGLQLSDPLDVTTDCGAGTTTSVAGATSFDFSGGSVAAGASCTIDVGIDALQSGSLVNTSGDLVSSAGNSGTASATLTAAAVPPTRSFTGALPSGNPGGLSFTTSDAACTFASDPVFIDASTVVPPPPAGVSFADGVASFSIERCTVGASVTVVIDYGVALDPGLLLYKSGDPWFTVPVTISGTTATFVVTDGGVGDSDGVANGTIVDPVGAGSPPAVSPPAAAPIPATPRWLLVLMSLMLMAIGMAMLRRRVPLPL